jgi:hypothetical protein
MMRAEIPDKQESNWENNREISCPVEPVKPVGKEG